MVHQKEIAAVVVLYHPDDTVLNNINTYIYQVDVIFVIDNTGLKFTNADLISKIKNMKKIFYIPNNENLGIAKALNIGAAYAIKSGYNFLLTMDQDSRATPTMVADLINCRAMRDHATLGILSPFHSTIATPTPPIDRKHQQVLTAWTSGSLLNLKAYRRTGPFNESLFIDFVDHEYCLRLNLAGYKIFKVNKAVLHHEIGNQRRHKLLWISPVSSNHSALRRYYITRNRFYLASRFKNDFPSFFRKDFVTFLKELVVIFLFERKKIDKYKMIFYGFCDYRKGILGKFQQQ